MSLTLVFYDMSTLFRRVETTKHIEYPPVAGAVQNISAQLQGGPNPPCCGALNWHCAGLWLAYLSKVAAHGMGIYTDLQSRSEQIKLAAWRGRDYFLNPEAGCLAYVQSDPFALGRSRAFICHMLAWPLVQRKARIVALGLWLLPMTWLCVALGCAMLGVAL